MSAFALVVHTDGSPVLEHERAAVRAKWSSRSERLSEVEISPSAWLLTSHDEGFEGPTGIWRNQSAGVAVISRHPLTSRDLAAAAAELDSPHPVPTRVRFPFVAVAWREGEVRVFVDQIGSRPAWWAEAGSITVVASESRTAIAHPAIDGGADLGILAERLAYRPSTPNRSIYKSAQLVPAGSWLRLANGAKPEVDRWHEWDLEPDDAVCLEEWALRLREATQQAIRAEFESLKGRGASMALSLSGGLDSSSLAGVIGHLGLDEQTVALCRRYPGLPCDESDYQEAVLDSSNFRAHFVESRPLDFVSDVADVIDRAGAPLFRVEPESDDAARLLTELGVHWRMSGVGGDEVFLPYEDRLVDALSDRRLGEAAALARQSSPRSLATSNRAWLPQSLRAQHRRWRLPPWINRDFAREVGLAERVEQEHEAAGRRGRALTRVYDIADSGWAAAVADTGEAMRARTRAEPVNPFLDPAVIQLALRVPDAMRSDQSDNRKLQRLAFSDVLPTLVRERRGKVHFDYRHALDLADPQLVEVLNDLQLGHDGLVDSAEVLRMHRRLMEAAADDLESIPPLATKIWSVVGHELWWRRVR